MYEIVCTLGASELQFSPYLELLIFIKTIMNIPSIARKYLQTSITYNRYSHIDRAE